MRAIFIADAHLRKPDDPNYRALLGFLEQQRGRTDCLVLLGDIFEFWIGKETVADDYVPLVDGLERLCRGGTQLVYVEGNHDFHMGPVFTHRLNCRVLPDGGCIELDGRKVYLAHGDLANRNDGGYRLLRRVLRSRLVGFLIRTVPDRVTMAIAARSSRKSRKKSAARRQRWPAAEVLRPYVEEILAAGHEAVVTGHYHQPYREMLPRGEHIALGDWITQYSYAVYEDGAFALASYDAGTAAALPPA